MAHDKKPLRVLFLQATEQISRISETTWDNKGLERVHCQKGACVKAQRYRTFVFFFLGPVSCLSMQPQMSMMTGLKKLFIVWLLLVSITLTFTLCRGGTW